LVLIIILIIYKSKMDNTKKEPLTKAVHKNPPGKVKIFIILLNINYRFLVFYCVCEYIIEMTILQ